MNPYLLGALEALTLVIVGALAGRAYFRAERSGTGQAIAKAGQMNVPPAVLKILAVGFGVMVLLFIVAVLIADKTREANL